MSEADPTPLVGRRPRLLDAFESWSQYRREAGIDSGGGALTAYLAALDPRIQAAASTCYITDWEDQLQGTGPQDAEQQFPGQLKNGLDHGDLIIAFAPKPFLICSTTEDFFPIAGARKTFREVQRIYQILGTGEKISQFVAPGEHGMPKPRREAIYGWMNEWLKGAPPSPAPEPHFETEYEQALLCTMTGQVSTSLGGDTASFLNIRRFLPISPARQPLKSGADVDRLKSGIREAVLQMTRYEPPHSRVAIQEEESRRNGYVMSRLTYEVSPGRSVPALLAVPESARRETVLFVDEQGMDADAQPGGDLDQLAQRGYTVLALDPSGLGEATPDWSGWSGYCFGREEKGILAGPYGGKTARRDPDGRYRGRNECPARKRALTRRGVHRVCQRAGWC